MFRVDESFHLRGLTQQYGPAKRKARGPPNFPPGTRWIDTDEGREVDHLFKNVHEADHDSQTCGNDERERERETFHIKKK